MIVRLLKPWKFRKVGHVFNDMPDGAANMLVKRGFAEVVRMEKTEKKKQEKAASVRV